MANDRNLICLDALLIFKFLNISLVFSVVNFMKVLFYLGKQIKSKCAGL